MGKLFLILMISASGICFMARPWLGIATYYLLAILGPQYIWWWIFDDLRVSYWVAIFTFIGIAVNTMKKKFDFSFLRTRQNLLLLFLWLFIVISYYFGPYVSEFNSPGLKPDQLLSITNNIFLCYFCATLLINDINKLRYLSIIIAITTVYLVYWANAQYVMANWSQFNNGRLMGPADLNGGSIYRDENAFAMLFVTGLPFVYYMGFEISKKWLRCALWCVIPFGCHAVFLTGSRGGLLGLGVVTLFCLLNSKRRLLAVPVILLLIMFYQWQAGSVMKQRGELISDYKGESSAEQRLTAWKGGLKMMEEHPLTGVGLGSFITALPLYYDTEARVAHNTLIQFTAESGFGAGLCYLIIVYTFIRNSRIISLKSREQDGQPYAQFLQNYNNASKVSFLGLIVCSLFLSLNTYEIFFFLLIFNNSLTVLSLQSKAPVDTAYLAA